VGQAVDDQPVADGVHRHQDVVIACARLVHLAQLHRLGAGAVIAAMGLWHLAGMADADRPVRTTQAEPSRYSSVVLARRVWRRLVSVGCGLQAIEDEVEPELELDAEVVAGLENMLGRQLQQVGVLAGGQVRGDGRGEVGHVDAAGRRKVGLLQREPIDVAVDQRVGVRREPDREAGAT
jgi:hypothetical protein